MPKSKSKLDRKTRRAIENAIHSTVNGTKASKKKSGSSTLGSFSLNASGGLTGWASSTNVKSGSSNPPPLKELPPITGTLHVTHYIADDLHWHLKVADKMLPGIDWTIVGRIAEINEVSFDQLAFYSEADKDAFEAWMGKYLEKFGKHADLMLPPPVDGVFPHHVRSNFERRRSANNSLNSLASSDDSHEQMLEQWLWILENCEGEVRHAGTFWFFAEVGDATLFRMAYS